jgi:beta-phosphoglucomutase-like phosphatase (HAD superfamily)
MPVEAIFFDLDDTLVDDAASFRIATARVCAELDGGLDQALLTATYVQVSDDYWTSRAYAYGDLYEVRLQLWRTALSACGCDDDSSASRASRPLHDVPDGGLRGLRRDPQRPRGPRR